MTPQLFAYALVSLVSIVALWAFYSVAYKRYRLDKYRYQLFTLRAQLFDMACAGTISFEEPAYQTLRITLNGFIRFAHKMQFAPLVFFLAQEGAEDRAPEYKTFDDIWKEQLRPLPKPVRAQLNGVLIRMHEVAIEQVFLTSPILLIGAPFAIGLVALKHSGQALGAKIYHSVRKWIKTSWIDAVNTAAFQEGAMSDRLAA